MTLMQRSLSSSVTVWWKFVFPTLWITGFGVATVAMWLGAFQSRDNTPTPDWMRWQFLVMWLVASAFLIWFARRLRRVSLCDGRLTASNYFREVSIPVASISKVTQSYMSNPQTITIHLDHQTALGRRILFVPVGRAHYISEHPITTELKGLSTRTPTDNDQRA